MTPETKTTAPVLRAAIFDLDGTLVDSMGVWERIDRAFLGRRGLPEDADYLAALKNMNYRRAAEYTIGRFGLTETPQDLMAEWDRMAVWEYGHTIPLKPGAKELLEELKQRGIPVALATVSGPALYNAVLKRHGIDRFFDAVTAADTGIRGKESPDVYLRAASLLRTEPERCVVFEDLLMGIQVASGAGFATCAVEDPSSETEREALRLAADYYVKDLREVIPLLGDRLAPLTKERRDP